MILIFNPRNRRMIPTDKHMYIYIWYYLIYIYIYTYAHIWFNHQHVGYYQLPKAGPVTMAFERRPIEARSSERRVQRRRPCRRALLLGRRCAVQARTRSGAGELGREGTGFPQGNDGQSGVIVIMIMIMENYGNLSNGKFFHNGKLSTWLWLG